MHLFLYHYFFLQSVCQDHFIYVSHDSCRASVGKDFVVKQSLVSVACKGFVRIVFLNSCVYIQESLNQTWAFLEPESSSNLVIFDAVILLWYTCQGDSIKWHNLNSKIYTTSMTWFPRQWSCDVCKTFEGHSIFRETSCLSKVWLEWQVSLTSFSEKLTKAFYSCLQRTSLWNIRSKVSNMQCCSELDFEAKLSN